MNLHRLRLLHHLHALGTVTATAEALNLTVPAVSQQLGVLEREVGITLLERAGRRLTFTPAGEALAAHAEVLLAGVAAAEADLASLRDGHAGRVTLAAFPSAARALVPPVWRRLARPRDPATDAGPVIDLCLTEQEPEAALASLTRRDADVAIVHAYSLLPRDLPPGCEARLLLDEPVLLAVSPDLAARLELAPDDPVDLADLAGRTDWVAPATDTSCHEMMRRACGAAGFVPNVRATASDFSVLTALVAAGAGAALVPRLALPDGLPDVRLFAVDPPVHRSVLTATPQANAPRPDVRAVLQHLEEVAAALDLAALPDRSAAGPRRGPVRRGTAGR